MNECRMEWVAGRREAVPKQEDGGYSKWKTAEMSAVRRCATVLERVNYIPETLMPDNCINISTSGV